MEYPKYEGNCPKRVNKDAKYSVRTGSGPDKGPVIMLTYAAQEGEKWYAATDQHPELVNMVNRVKTSLGLQPNGAFYINEYKQVIVPTAASEDYYLAGTYGKPLRFDFDGMVLSGDAMNLEGMPLSPGDKWDGPHPGIPYKLKAGGNDISYTISRVVVGGTRTREYSLSAIIGPERARITTSQITAVKGTAGGRVFVNEFQEMFAPVNEKAQWEYVYIGKLDLDYWFPKPHTEQ